MYLSYFKDWSNLLFELLLIKLIYAHDLRNNSNKTESVYCGKIELLKKKDFDISHDLLKKPIKHVLDTY